MDADPGHLHPPELRPERSRERVPIQSLFLEPIARMQPQAILPQVTGGRTDTKASMGDDDSSKKKKQIRNSTAEFLIFSAQTGGDDLEVRYEDETIWLTLKLMAHLFGVDVRTVSEHLVNIFDQAKLQRDATIRNFRIVKQRVPVRSPAK